MTRTRTISLLASVALLLSAACARSTAVKVAEGSHSPIAPSSATSRWLVVLRAADAPSGVQDDADALAPVLGDAIEVAPGSCFTGIPERFGGDRYILGAVGDTKREVDTLAAEANVEPLFEGVVQVVCVD